MASAEAFRPGSHATGIPQDRLHVRSGMDRLIHSKIRLIQIRPPGSARSAHTPVDRKLAEPPVRGSTRPVVSKSVSKIRRRRGARRGDLSHVLPSVSCDHARRPVTTPAANGLPPGAFVRKMRAGRARGPARRPRCGDARRASGTGDACASESPKHVTPAHQAGREAAQV